MKSFVLIKGNRYIVKYRQIYLEMWTRHTFSQLLKQGDHHLQRKSKIELFVEFNYEKKMKGLFLGKRGINIMQ